MPKNVALIDPVHGVEFIDETDLDLDGQTVWEAVAAQHPELAVISRWTNTATGYDHGSGPASGQGRRGTMFERDRFVTPSTTFDQFRVARDAVESDDVVSEVADSTEGLAFNRNTFLVEDEDEEDVWNQAFGLEALDLDSRLRELWRELFTYSQAYCCVWWGTKTFKVQGTTKAGNAKRKEYPNLTVPLGMTVLDPFKVVPIGNLVFNQERLGYIPDPDEMDMLDAAVDGDPQADPMAARIMLRRYTPSEYESQQLAEAGAQASTLYEMDPRYVFRHTLTRPQYQRFAAVRMKSVFELLDLKNQQRQNDRAHLIGGTNFIVLIKKGTDDRPAKPAEIKKLQAQVRTVARVPVIVGDHRLSVEIVTPKMDNTLQAERHDLLDGRIAARLYQMFMSRNYEAGSGGEDSVKVAMIVARGLESRRRQLKRRIEAKVTMPMYRANDALKAKPKLRFHPARISLSFDAAMVQFLIDARDRGDVSRESYLGEIEMTQADEALLRRREKDKYDKTFTPTNVPFSGPGSDGDGGGADTPKDPRTAGRNMGGRRNGGGAAPGSGQGQPPRRGRPKDT